MEKQVTFYSGPGLRLSGVMEITEGHDSKAPCPAVVLCHGPGGIKGFLMPQVSSRLVADGYVVLRFDYRGFGDSEGMKGRLIPLEQVEDTRNAITYLQQQESVDPERIGVWGSATGGSNAIYTAGVDRRVRCVVAVNAMGDLGRWLRSMRRYWEWLKFLEEIEQDRKQRVTTGTSRTVDSHDIILMDPASERYWAEHRAADLKSDRRQVLFESAEALMSFVPETVVSNISPRAAMWICAGLDSLLPTDESRSMYGKAGEPKLLAVLEGLEHHDLYWGPGFEKTMASTTEWFAAHLTGR